MAVLVEGISVVLKMPRLLECYRTWDAFVSIVPNATLCADGALARIGFMTPHDVAFFCQQLEQAGLIYLDGGHARDLVVVDQMRGFAAPCDWASFGHIDWDNNPRHRVAVCYNEDSPKKVVLTPDGWDYASSLTASFGFIPTEAKDALEILDDDDDGLLTVRTPLSDKPHYMGRIRVGANPVNGPSVPAPLFSPPRKSLTSLLSKMFH